MDTQLDEELGLKLDTEFGDHDRFAHYADKQKITEAMITGAPVVALCGKKWTPSRDPDKYPVCPTCREIYASMPE